MTNNVFTANFFADVHGAPILDHSSNLANTVARLLGAYSGSGNTYWNLYSPVVASSSAGQFGWGDLASTGLDSAPGRGSAQVFSTYATASAAANTFAASPGNLSSFTNWAQTGTSTNTVVTCPTPSTSGGCLEFKASTSAPAILITPTFAIKNQQFYRIHLQVTSQTTPPPILQVELIRNSSPWDNLDALNQQSIVQPLNGTWSVSDFYVQAKADVADARIDVDVPQSADIILGDLVITPVTVKPDPPEQHFQGLVNVDYAHSATFNCPFSGALCGGWTDPTGATVGFPVAVGLRAATPLWHP
jgi:hypothetical protein